MRISDWSSDVCSSDLAGLDGAEQPVIAVARFIRANRGRQLGEHRLERLFLAGLHAQRGDHTDGAHVNSPFGAGPASMTGPTDTIRKPRTGPPRPDHRRYTW